MTNTRIACLAALLCATAATPALAQSMDRIGSVDIGGRFDNDNRGPGGNMMGPGMRGPGMRGPGAGMDRDSVNFRLGGSIERLQLTAERSSVNCRWVRADFGNGRTREIYSGDLRQGRTVNVNLPGQERNLRGLDFNCSADDRRGATIRIAADVGRHRGEWQRNPDFQRQWSKMFNWGSQVMNNWQMISQERFEGRGDVETVFAGVRGRRTDSIALRPLETDARCANVSARFAKGQTQRLNINNGDTLRRGQYYKIDFPGAVRNLESLSMRCSAVGGRAVTMQVFVGR